MPNSNKSNDGNGLVLLLFGVFIIMAKIIGIVLIAAVAIISDIFFSSKSSKKKTTPPTDSESELNKGQPHTSPDGSSYHHAGDSVACTPFAFDDDDD